MKTITSRLATALFAALLPLLAGAATTPAGLPDFTELVDKQGPAVVNIAVTTKSKASLNIPGLSEDDPFYEFFKRFGQTPRGRERRSGRRRT